MNTSKNQPLSENAQLYLKAAGMFLYRLLLAAMLQTALVWFNVDMPLMVAFCLVYLVLALITEIKKPKAVDSK